MTDFTTSDRDVSRAIRSWLHEDRHEDASRLAGAVLDQVEVAAPRRRATRWPARRIEFMNKFVGFGLAAAAVVVAVFIGAQLFGSPSGGTGGPGDQHTVTQAPTATIGQGPSQAPGPSAAQTAVTQFPVFPGPPRPVDAGIYDLGPDFRGPDFPVTISFVVPAGWLSCANNAGLLCPADGVGGVDIFIVTNVVADPCDETTLRDPSVGPTVDDLVTAISSLPWSAVTPPTDVTVDGFRGKEFEVTAPNGSACAGDAFAVWVATLNGRVHEVSPGERNRLRILEVQGTRVVIAGSYRPGTTSLQDLAEINAIIDSVRIEP
jgi:hypothetical protein